MIHTPTTQQLAAYTKATTTRNSFSVTARAGTGKTYTAKQIARKIRGGGWATSFSTLTTRALAEAMPPKFQVTGLHAQGRKAIINSGKYTELDTSKVYKILTELITTRNLSWELKGPALKLVGLAKTFGIVPNSFSKGLLLDLPESWTHLADEFDISYCSDTLDLAHEALLESNKLALKNGIIDFDDMLYISTLWPHRFPRFANILADEDQDFNALQELLIKKCLLPGGRLISFGDDRQSIYAFRGALANAHEQLIQTFDMDELHLTFSFRCPQTVVLEAQKHVPDIEAMPSAPIGSVDFPSHLQLSDLPKTILCRNNAPPISLALRLIAAGHTAEVAGKEIGTGLISLTRRITKKKNLKTPDFLSRLHRWGDREISRKPKFRERVEDKIAVLTAIGEHHSTLQGIRNHLEKLYPDPKSKAYRPSEYYLSTIHKAKGLEWPHVAFLDPHLIPSKGAHSDRELLQEDNLAYVGITRAQQSLTYIRSEDIH